MNGTRHLDFENDIVRYYVENNTGVLRFKDNIFESFSNLDMGNLLQSFLDWIEQDKIVKSILILNEPSAFSEKGYSSFLNQILQKDENKKFTGIVIPEMRVLRARQMNAFRNFILKIINFSKIVVFGLQGEIVTPFIGTVLAGDFRYATPDTVFSMAHLKYNIYPVGAVPFFLGRCVGQAKALDLLLRSREIKADEALELGLINEIINGKEYESKCREKADYYASFNSRMIELTKSLTYNIKKELDQYFTDESHLVGY
jgi:enoyl-CoA hydratase/carnithine racemase